MGYGAQILLMFKVKRFWNYTRHANVGFEKIGKKLINYDKKLYLPNKIQNSGIRLRAGRHQQGRGLRGLRPGVRDGGARPAAGSRTQVKLAYQESGLVRV